MELFKIEIIIPNPFLQQLIELMEETGATGYTALDISRGKGLNHGEQLSEGLLPTSRNSLIFLITTPFTKEKLIDKVQSFVERYSGAIIVSKVEFASGLA
jgi:nitrogen regulatory protein PII